MASVLEWYVRRAMPNMVHHHLDIKTLTAWEAGEHCHPCLMASIPIYIYEKGGEFGTLNEAPIYTYMYSVPPSLMQEIQWRFGTLNEAIDSVEVDRNGSTYTLFMKQRTNIITETT